MPSYQLKQIGNAIYIVYQLGKQQAIATKISVAPQFFDRTAPHGAWFKKGCPDRDNLNIILAERLSELRGFVNRYFQDKKVYPEPRSMRGFFNAGGTSRESLQVLWNNFCRYQTTKEDKPIGDERLKSYTSMYNHLMAYDAGLKLADMNLEFYTAFKKYLRLELAIGVNSVSKYIKIIKAFLSWAIAQGHSALPLPELKKFKAEEADRDICFHESHELQMLMDTDLSKHPHLESTCDDYLLQCFTGLRHSDIGVRWSDSGGFLRLLTTKTGEEVVIPIRAEVRWILDKYQGRPFPKMENAPYNRQIKDLGLLAGITQEVIMVKGRRKHKPGEALPKYKLMTSHMGRATFICNMIEANVHYKKIMAMTGIKKIETLEHYAAVVDKSLTLDMQEVERRQGLVISHLKRSA